MDFDEYEYLEKTVEGEKDGSSPARKSAERADKSEKGGYRRRERSVEDNSGEDDDEDRKSKKSRGDDENGAKREDRERSSRHRSSRDGDRDVDRERDRDRDRDRRRSSRDVDKDRERDRSSKERERDGGSRDKRDKERDRERRDKEKEREREKDRGDKEKDRDRERDRERREREKEKERDGSRRSRSRSMSTRRHDADREREKEIIRERERDLELRESGRRFKDKKEAEPEADPERDQRTVFAYQMPLKATERDVYEFFSRAGKVRDVRLIMDRNSRRSKGVGYIEFYDAMSVPMAIALSGQLLLGQPVMVKPSEAEKNLVQSSASSGTSVVGPYGAADRKLYVGNLHFNMTEGQLKQIFEAFGPVELVQLPTDPETGHCKGFGFIQFAQLEHAKAAQSLNGKLEIGGRTIKVSSVTDHVSQESGVKASDLDDDDGGGLSLNAQSRALLMQKLDRSGTATGITGPLGVPVLNGAVPTQPNIVLPMNGQSMIPATVFPPLMPSMPPEPIGKPSECLLLKNMFDPAAETEPGFDLDIQEDVYEECSKYGHVKHIHVDKPNKVLVAFLGMHNCAQIISVVPELTEVNSIRALNHFKVVKHLALESIRNSAGYVYLRFETVKESETAQQAMHKRWFARKLISAIFLQPYEYEAKFNGTA